MRRFETRASDVAPSGVALTSAHLCIAGHPGANVKVLQTLLGHKPATMTLDRYGHLMPDDLDEISKAMDAAAESAAYRD